MCTTDTTIYKVEDSTEQEHNQGKMIGRSVKEGNNFLGGLYK